eukprot:gene34906-60984_t
MSFTKRGADRAVLMWEILDEYPDDERSQQCWDAYFDACHLWANPKSHIVPVSMAGSGEPTPPMAPGAPSVRELVDAGRRAEEGMQRIQ